MKKTFIVLTFLSVSLFSKASDIDPVNGLFFSFLTSTAIGIIPVSVLAMLYAWVTGGKKDKGEKTFTNGDFYLLIFFCFLAGLLIKTWLFR